MAIPGQATVVSPVARQCPQNARKMQHILLHADPTNQIFGCTGLYSKDPVVWLRLLPDDLWRSCFGLGKCSTNRPSKTQRLDSLPMNTFTTLRASSCAHQVKQTNTGALFRGRLLEKPNQNSWSSARTSLCSSKEVTYPDLNSSLWLFFSPKSLSACQHVGSATEMQPSLRKLCHLAVPRMRRIESHDSGDA